MRPVEEALSLLSSSIYNVLCVIINNNNNNVLCVAICYYYFVVFRSSIPLLAIQINLHST